MFPTNPRALLLALATSLALAANAGEAGAQEPSETEPAPPTETETQSTTAAAAVNAARVRALRRQIRKYRARTWHWQRVMARPRTPTSRVERRTTSIALLVAIRNDWRRRTRLVVQRRARRVPHAASWRCIHRHEGAWDDPNALYYGGLQMDITFQRTYGRYLLRTKGTADRWRPLEQMWTAEKARRSGRGFHPWPNTARRCGLL